MRWLLLDPGSPGEKPLSIEGSSATIGRGTDESINIQHRSLSRRHARLTIEGGRAKYIGDAVLAVGARRSDRTTTPAARSPRPWRCSAG